MYVDMVFWFGYCAGISTLAIAFAGTYVYESIGRGYANQRFSVQSYENRIEKLIDELARAKQENAGQSIYYNHKITDLKKEIDELREELEELREESDGS